MIKKIIKRIEYKLTNIRWHTPASCSIHRTAQCHGSFFEGMNKVSRGCLLNHSSVGLATYIGVNSSLNNCSIGRFCSISQDVRLITGSHPTKDFISTHPLFYAKEWGKYPGTKEQKFQEYIYAENSDKYAVIENDVWIGTGVSIMQGVTIGTGSILAAGALITKSVPPFAIVGGVPAKIIRYRFSENQRQIILQSKWWEKPIHYLQKYADNFENIEKFKQITQINID